MRRSTVIASLAVLLLGGLFVFTSAKAQQSSTNQTASVDGVFIARGDYNVFLLIDGESAPRQLRRVTEVSLLRDWAVIHRNESGKNITLVIPRDTLISMEMND